MMLDVGPETVARDRSHGSPSSQTLVWNGPLGAFETPPFDAATSRSRSAVAAATEAGGLRSVAGGGDTVAALRQAGVAERLTYVSTAGRRLSGMAGGQDAARGGGPLGIAPAQLSPCRAVTGGAQPPVRPAVTSRVHTK